MPTAASLIADSIHHDHITHAPATLDLVADLTEACDDSVQNGDTLELWGTNNDGDEWRVHLDGSVQPEAAQITGSARRRTQGVASAPVGASTISPASCGAPAWRGST